MEMLFAAMAVIVIVFLALDLAYGRSSGYRGRRR